MSKLDLRLINPHVSQDNPLYYRQYYILGYELEIREHLNLLPVFKYSITLTLDDCIFHHIKCVSIEQCRIEAVKLLKIYIKGVR